MMDDIDRDCCHTFKSAIMDAVPDGWDFIKGELHDPGWTLVYAHRTKGFVGQPTVTITIEYGDKS